MYDGLWTIFINSRMPPFKKTTALIFCLFLSFNTKSILAESAQEIHANPSLIHDEIYGPIQKNDTLWSIAKLLKKHNESINEVVDELVSNNPEAIKSGGVLFAGYYIHRHSSPVQPQDTTPDIESVEQIPRTTPETEESVSPIDTNIDLVITNPTEDTVGNTTEIMPYALFALVTVLIGLGFGLTKLRKQRSQQKIIQDEIDKANALKRELIKNRLKETSVIEFNELQS